MGSRKTRSLPGRSPEVISSEFDGEFVAVNTGTGEAHALSGDVATVWRSVQDGSVPELSGDRVDEIVAELTVLGLLDADGVSRRTLLKAGAAGGATLALAGITTMALPAAAMAGSSRITFSTPGSDPLVVPPGATFTYTICGAGGGGGGAVCTSDHHGANGGAGASITGTITNNTGEKQTLTVVVGCGGCGGLDGGSASPGKSGFSAGGAGGCGSSPSSEYAGGGAGGGASAILAGTTAIVVAGAGAGGGGADQAGGGTSNGAGGLTTSSASGGAGTSGNGISGTPSKPGAGGGGGGGGTLPSSIGASAGNGGYGGTGGSSYFPSTVPYGAGHFTITATASNGGGGGGAGAAGPSQTTGAAGANGSATFLGGGIST